MKAIATQYQLADGDDKVTGSIVDQLMVCKAIIFI